VPAHLRFCGLIANVDETILRLRTLAGCEITSLSEAEAIRLVRRTRKLDRIGAYQLLTWETRCLNTAEHRAYALTKSIQFQNLRSLLEAFADMTGRWSVAFAAEMNDAIPTFEALRLSADGNICMPFHTTSIESGAVRRRLLWGGTTLPVIEAPFKVPEGLAMSFPDFLAAYRVSRPDTYVHLARRHFELAYSTPRREIALIVLMTALEILLTADTDPLQGTGRMVARRAGALVEDNPKDGRVARKRLGKLYDLRNDVVHEGKGNTVTAADVSDLRGFVRRALLGALSLNLEKRPLVLELDRRSGLRSP